MTVQQTSTRSVLPVPDAIPPVRIEARSQMGKRFRLTDAFLVVDGIQVSHFQAQPKQELDLTTRALNVHLDGGQHTLTVILVYQGRSAGLFSYLDQYRFRAVTNYPFYLEKAVGQPVIRILGRERPGANVPLEKKPTVDISSPLGSGITPMSGVTHGTEVTVMPVTRRPVDRHSGRVMATMVMSAVGRRPSGEFLGQIPIFGGLSEEVLRRIAEAGTVGELPAGAQLISEGEPARSLFVVYEGELEICKRGGQGVEVRLAVLHPGDCLGEMSLIDIQPRSATARALSPAVVFRLGHGEIGKLRRSHPEVYTLLVLNIAREISRRLRAADQALANLGVSLPEMWANERSAPAT